MRAKSLPKSRLGAFADDQVSDAIYLPSPDRSSEQTTHFVTLLSQLNRLTSSFVYIDFCVSDVYFVSEISLFRFLQLLFVLTWNIQTDLQHFRFSSLLMNFLV